MAKLRISSKPAFQKLEVFTKRVVTTPFVGSYKSIFRGRGLEFEDYRAYTPDDDASFIDWKATLRANEMLVKEFGEERALDVFLLIDVGSTMVFSSTPKLKNEYAAELASSLCFAILQTGDSVGFALFSNKAIYKSHPMEDTKQFYCLLNELTNPKNYGGSFDLKNAIEFAMAYIRASSVLIIISDFIRLGKNWEILLNMAARKFDIIGVMVRDPRDKTLPAVGNRFLMEDPFSGKQLLIQPDMLRDKYNRAVAKQESMIREAFKKAGAGFVSLSTEQNFSNPIRAYFNRRLREFR